MASAQTGNVVFGVLNASEWVTKGGGDIYLFRYFSHTHATTTNGLLRTRVDETIRRGNLTVVSAVIVLL